MYSESGGEYPEEQASTYHSSLAQSFDCELLQPLEEAGNMNAEVKVASQSD